MSLVLQLNPDFIEVHPNRRYGRYGEVIGRYDSKTVYRAFDECKGIEVAWNQVKSYDFVHSSEDLKKLYSEIRLAKNFKHDNILKFYTCWVDNSTKNINFVTEMFSSSLRQYRLKHKRVSVWTIKHWCRQILRALAYLHSQDPPVIHRDIRSDNIFINGAQGKVKIGDLGLSGIVHSANFVEVHEETYNELADMYSFGMCILEMITSETPYSECANPFEFFKKLRSGEKPAALDRVNDQETREFVEKCLAPVSLRLSAKELLNDPFLRNSEGFKYDLRLLDSRKVDDKFGISARQHQLLDLHNSSTGDSSGAKDFWEDYESSLSDDFEYHDHQHLAKIDMSIKAKWINGITFLRLEAADGKNSVQKDYPSGLEIERALSVATELVAKLESRSSDQDVTKAADMIKAAISSMESGWITKPAKYTHRELQRLENTNYERYNIAGARPSEQNVMFRCKNRDTVTNNPLGIKASVWSVFAKSMPSNQLVSSPPWTNPTIY